MKVLLVSMGEVAATAESHLLLDLAHPCNSLVAARSKARVCALGLDPDWRR